MRHIPEDEIHAYLDQALSRSQGVEIEMHLAQCPRCQLLRDDIARLRDRTTALLAELGPAAVVPPAYATLKARAAQRVHTRRRWMLAAGWAASLGGAVLLGWTLRRPAAPQFAIAPVPVSVPATAPIAAPPEPQARPAANAAQEPRGPATPRRLVRVDSGADENDPPVRFASMIEASQEELLPLQGRGAQASEDLPDLMAQPVGADQGLQGLWRTVVPDSTGLLRSVDVPLVPGLPVVQMRVQPGEDGPDVTAVDQLLESGELVRTLAGPAARVAALVASDRSTEGSQAAPGQPSRVTVTIQQGDRMVAVTGPSPVLGSLLNRVHARRRY